MAGCAVLGVAVPLLALGAACAAEDHAGAAPSFRDELCGETARTVSENLLGPDGARFLTGDVNHDGRTDLIHPGDDGTGRLKIDVSLATDTGYTPLSTSSNLGQGSAALRFLTGDVNADGQTDVIQLWDNGGRLGINLYGSNGTGYSVLSATGDIGQASAALEWLTGDVNLDGRTDIIQLFDNGGRLGIIVYGSNGMGYSVLNATPNIGQGSGALAWLTGDINHDGRTDIIQPWNNGGQLGFLVYEYISDAIGYAVMFGTQDIGQSSGALAWLTGDIDGDGGTDVIQAFDNGGRLGLLGYVSTRAGGLSLLFKTPNTGQGSGALAWLTGDVNRDGKTDIIQPWNNGGRLGYLVYASNGAGYSVLSGTQNIGQGSAALTWLTGDFNHDGRTDLLQPWANGTRLGLLVYTSDGTELVTAFGSADLGPL